MKSGTAKLEKDLTAIYAVIRKLMVLIFEKSPETWMLITARVAKALNILISSKYRTLLFTILIYYSSEYTGIENTLIEIFPKLLFIPPYHCIRTFHQHEEGPWLVGG